jgi:hypothetical protein
MAEKQMTAKEIYDLVYKMDPKCEEASAETAAMLLASALVGPHAGRIGKLLGIPEDKIAKRARRLRRNGVWNKDRVEADWTDAKSGAVAFWLDVCVADGLVRRVDE